MEFFLFTLAPVAASIVCVTFDAVYGAHQRRASAKRREAGATREAVAA
jgi:hypothetical protein